MKTPTPRTDECIRTAGIDHSGEAYKLARTLERELAAMTARAEAAEALVAEKDKVLNQCAYPNYCGGERADLVTVIQERQDIARAALALTPATMGAELARLREKTAMTLGVGNGTGQLFVHGDYDSIKACQAKLLDNETLRARLAEQDAELCELRPLCLEHRDAHDAMMAQRDALIAWLSPRIEEWRKDGRGMCTMGRERMDELDSIVNKITAAKQCAQPVDKK